MLFKNHSPHTLKLVNAAVAASISKGPGVRPIVRKWRGEGDMPGTTSQHRVGVEIDPGATFEVDELYAAPRSVAGTRAPSPLEELAMCPDCDDVQFHEERVFQSAHIGAPPLKLKCHKLHTAIMPVDDGERERWLSRDQERVIDPSQLPPDLRMARELAATRDENAGLKARMEKLEALIEASMGAKAKKA